MKSPLDLDMDEATGPCTCCGNPADLTDGTTGACLPCAMDGANGKLASCAACRGGGRLWIPLPDGDTPPSGAFLRTLADGRVEYALDPPEVLRERLELAQRAARA